ncbi:hypothetical protein Tsubulata_029719 [Turnera subulata]|uniref:Uncharacterized protein n=1 Tax=Turnera subulata TaxID=218843 RepID=A0A9Q0FEY9_9ROSI|nr:hypothetical protein Tsubulata_029719 [Turnera subulata]
MGKGRAPCCDKSQVKKGPWSPAEDLRLISFIQKNGHENWRALPKQAGLLRCGKSCRLRWINYLRPDVKRGNFTKEEEETIIRLHQTLGNKWSKIASHLPGRTDNEIKNVWNTHLKKRLSSPKIEPKESSITSSSSSSSSTIVSSDDKIRNMEGEVGEQWDHGSMAKKPRVSDSQGEVSNEFIPSKEVAVKELSSSSMSSNNSNVTHSSTQVGLITPKPENEIGSLLDIIVPYTNLHATLEEVNKPEGINGVDIPLESDFDFWNMLDNLSAFQSNEVQLMNNVPASPFGYGEGEVEHKKWLFYMENELGLEAAKDHGSQGSHQSKGDVADQPPAIPQNFYREKLPNQEIGPGVGTFHLWPSL